MHMNNIDFWKSKIKENQRTFLELENQIEQESCFEKRCDLACDAATFAVRHTTDIFASSIIENVFLELAQKHSIELEKTVRQNTVLHIMTEAYTSGGHTRCVERWIQLFPEQEHSCVILNQNAQLPNLLREVVEASGGHLELYSATDTMLSKALKLRKYASNFEYVILHIHMDDPIALIAFGTEEFERPIVFFNHADHTFWLGVSVSDHVADLNTYRNSITIEKRGVCTSSILGIPVDDTEILKINKFDARRELNIPADKKIIFSSGQPNKYDPLGSPNFYNIVSDLVEKDENIIFYIAGADKNSIFWPKLKEKYPKNLFLTGRLDYKTKYPLYLSASDLVIDSYPVGGETSMIDAVKAGKPILTLNEVMSADYCVNSEACCKSYEELLLKAIKILNDFNYANEVYSNIYDEWKKETNPSVWRKKCIDLLSGLPKKHMLHKFERLIPNYDVTRCSLETCRWTEPSYGDNSFLQRIKKFRKNLIQIRIKKNEKIIRIFGWYLLRKKGDFSAKTRNNIF